MVILEWTFLHNFGFFIKAKEMKNFSVFCSIFRCKWKQKNKVDQLKIKESNIKSFQMHITLHSNAATQRSEYIKRAWFDLHDFKNS